LVGLLQQVHVVYGDGDLIGKGRENAPALLRPRDGITRRVTQLQRSEQAASRLKRQIDENMLAKAIAFHDRRIKQRVRPADR
jgi:hypothetical protein